MARKTTGTTTSTRSKKAATPAPPAAVQAVSEVPKEVQKEILKEVPKEVRKNGKANNIVPIKASVNLEEEIRRRAYELYLERRATAGSESGDENQDWLIAEREILSRGREQHTA